MRTIPKMPVSLPTLRPQKRKLHDEGSGDSGRSQEIYSRLAKNRIIFLSEDVTKEVGCAFCAWLLFYDHDNDKEEIKIFINSNGGDATALSHMYDVMQMIRAPVSTYCIGKAYSAAAVLLAAGSPGKRYATKHCDVMIHGLQALFPQNENADKVDSEIDLKMLEAHNELVMKILSKHTGRELSSVAEDCKRDFYMDAAQALKYGMVDHIL